MKLAITFICVFLSIYTSYSQGSYPELAQKFGQNERLLNRLEILNKDIKQKGISFVESENKSLITGYSYKEFFDWDLYFENIYLSYYGVSEYCFTNFKSFFERQYLNGFVPRTLLYNKNRFFHHFKPFLAQLAYLGCVQINNFTWLEERNDRGFRKSLTNISWYEQMKKYLDYWFLYQDFDLNGLPIWMDSGHSGMDNQYSRSGNIRLAEVEGVDLACYLYRELVFMAEIAKRLNHANDSEMFIRKSEQIKKLINKVFWDEEDGFFYDRNERTGKLVKVKSASSFAVLWGNIADPEKAKRMIEEHLVNPNEFWLEYPVASYAKTETDFQLEGWDGPGCNWRGPTWIPTNYYIFHGLLNYGYTDVAKELAEKSFELVLDKNESTREYYDGETGSGFGLNPFWGWSSLAYFMPLEYELNYDPTNLKTKIRPIGNDFLNINFP